MKKAILISAMGVAAATSATVASAQEVGRVISSTPVIQQVAVQRQVCNTQPIAMQQPGSGGGAGTVLGAIVGGALGNQIGHGGGRAAATILGVVGGAAVGNNMEQQNYQQQPQYAQQCSPQVSYENRTVGYNVQYEYAGKQYTVQMPYDPGPTIRLQVSPMSSNNAAPFNSAAPSDGVQPDAGAPVGVILADRSTAMYPAYAYPAYGYYPRPYFYPPIGISLGFGFSGHHHHGHWR